MMQDWRISNCRLERLLSKSQSAAVASVLCSYVHILCIIPPGCYVTTLFPCLQLVLISTELWQARESTHIQIACKHLSHHTSCCITIISSYYSAAAGVVIVYDVTKRLSFTHVEKWLGEARKRGNADTMMILVGNKYDQRDIREVSVSEAREYAGENMYVWCHLLGQCYQYKNSSWFTLVCVCLCVHVYISLES